MKKRSALKQNIKKDTCIEFRRNIKALTLLAIYSIVGQHEQRKNFDEQRVHFYFIQ